MINERIREGIFVNYFIADIKSTDMISACSQMPRAVFHLRTYICFSLLRVYDEGVRTADTVYVSLCESVDIKLRLNEFRVKLVE